MGEVEVGRLKTRIVPGDGVASMSGLWGDRKASVGWHEVLRTGQEDCFRALPQPLGLLAVDYVASTQLRLRPTPAR